jgi:hypothetical protein
MAAQFGMNLQARQDMTLNLRGWLLAVALSLWAIATYAAGEVTVYKDAT